VVVADHHPDGIAIVPVVIEEVTHRLTFPVARARQTTGGDLGEETNGDRSPQPVADEPTHQAASEIVVGRLASTDQPHLGVGHAIEAYRRRGSQQFEQALGEVETDAGGRRRIGAGAP
jgi:hypothetical protein